MEKTRHTVKRWIIKLEKFDYQGVFGPVGNIKNAKPFSAMQRDEAYRIAKSINGTVLEVDVEVEDYAS